MQRIQKAKRAGAKTLIQLNRLQHDGKTSMSEVQKVCLKFGVLFLLLFLGGIPQGHTNPTKEWPSMDPDAISRINGRKKLTQHLLSEYREFEREAPRGYNGYYSYPMIVAFDELVALNFLLASEKLPDETRARVVRAFIPVIYGDNKNVAQPYHFVDRLKDGLITRDRSVGAYLLGHSLEGNSNSARVQNFLRFLIREMESSNSNLFEDNAFVGDDYLWERLKILATISIGIRNLKNEEDLLSDIEKKSYTQIEHIANFVLLVAAYSNPQIQAQLDIDSSPSKRVLWAYNQAEKELLRALDTLPSQSCSSYLRDAGASPKMIKEFSRKNLFRGLEG